MFRDMMILVEKGEGHGGSVAFVRSSRFFIIVVFERERWFGVRNIAFIDAELQELLFVKFPEGISGLVELVPEFPGKFRIKPGDGGLCSIIVHRLASIS
jgi:hypothetical protein